MTASDLFALTTSGLLVVTVASLLLGVRRRRPVVRAVVGVALVAVMLVPVDGLILAGYVRGLAGDLSMTTLVLIVCACITSFTDRELFDRRNDAAAMGWVLLAGAFLYPFALGLTTYDTYALGYGSRVFWAVLLLVALASWALDSPVVAAMITLGVAAYLGGVLESRNLWDYLIDPIAVLIGIVWVLQRLTALGLRLAGRRGGRRAGRRPQTG